MDQLIDRCLTPTLIVFQLYPGVTKYKFKTSDEYIWYLPIIWHRMSYLIQYIVQYINRPQWRVHLILTIWSSDTEWVIWSSILSSISTDPSDEYIRYLPYHLTQNELFDPVYCPVYQQTQLIYLFFSLLFSSVLNISMPKILNLKVIYFFLIWTIVREIID